MPRYVDGKFIPLAFYNKCNNKTPYLERCTIKSIKLLFLQCFVFHLYKGVRAGGGIGDELEPPDGDALEGVRILFDISFFFFIIVILLAIIQGNYVSRSHGPF